MKLALPLACLAAMMPWAVAHADQGAWINTGGSLSGGTPVASPPGTLTIAGNTLAFRTTDQATSLVAPFGASSTVENCSGGGRGGHITCTYTFSGSFSGVLGANGGTQGVNGSTVQYYGTDGVVISGATGYNSAYTPFYFSNSGQIVRSDDLAGTNLVTYGTTGSGVGQFYGAYGVALDAAGRIVVADTYNDRLVRIDDMRGTHWASFGSYGAGVGQFANPQGLSIDAAGRIYVMDTGNARLVRMDDLSGAGWTVFSGSGAGVGQLADFDNAVAFDASGRIYIADTGNRRIVRMDDMQGTNWTTLAQSPVINGYVFSFGSPVGVGVDAAGRIYVADANTPAVVRVDDMSGNGWTRLPLAAGATPHSLVVDAGGMVLVGGGGAQLVDGMVAAQPSAAALTNGFGPYYVFGATLAPVTSPPPSALGFVPATLAFSQNVGGTSASQAIAVRNFGGAPMNVTGIATAAPFTQSNDCPPTLAGGASCTVNVSFTPAQAGKASGTLVVNDDSANLGTHQSLKLTGTGTTPAVTLKPTALTFATQAVGTSSKPRPVRLTSSGNGPLAITGVATTGPFSQTNDCPGVLAPAATCTIQVTFTPVATGPASGLLTITDGAGTQQVRLSARAD